MMSTPELAGNARRGAFAKGVKSGFGASGLVFGVIGRRGVSSAESAFAGSRIGGVTATGFRFAEAGTNVVIGANVGSLLAGAGGTGPGAAGTDGASSSAIGDGVTSGTGLGSTGLS